MKMDFHRLERHTGPPPVHRSDFEWIGSDGREVFTPCDERLHSLLLGGEYELETECRVI
jgi:hypothetical protein